MEHRDVCRRTMEAGAVHWYEIKADNGERVRYTEPAQHGHGDGYNHDRQSSHGVSLIVVSEWLTRISVTNQRYWNRCEFSRASPPFRGGACGATRNDPVGPQTCPLTSNRLRDTPEHIDSVLDEVDRMMSGGLITLSASVEYTVEQARGVLHADRSVPRTIPSHLTMT